MFEHIVNTLVMSEDFPADTHNWCQQWCRMVNTGNDRENLCHPYGLLVATASQSNPQALQKMIALMWETGTKFKASPQSSLKTAVGTLLATAAPFQAHIALMTALKEYHKHPWSDPQLSKQKAMDEGVHVQTLATVMDHLAHAYIIPIDNKLSARELTQIFDCAGPVFVERFSHICGNYTLADNIASAFNQMSEDVSSNVIIRNLKSTARPTNHNSLLQCVAANTSFNHIVDTARTQHPDNLQALEIDRSNFAALSEASQRLDYETSMDRVLTRQSQSVAVVKEVAGVWTFLVNVYPNEKLSPTNTDVLEKFMHYCQPQQGAGINEDVYAQLQNLLLHSQLNRGNAPTHLKARKI